MNILYLYGNVIDPEKGGVQRVTSVLADYFENLGHSIYYLALEHKDNHNIHPIRQYLLPCSQQFFCDENILFLKRFLEENEITILINQGGLGIDPSLLSYTAKDYGVKIIQVLHNSLLSKIYHFESAFADRFKTKRLSFLLPLSRTCIIKFCLLQIYKKRYSSHFKELCNKSDQVVLLSSAFMPELEFFTEDLKLMNVTFIGNPISFPASDQSDNKQKEILYVGRIDTSQKRVDLLLWVWKCLWGSHLDWRLTIVGGGDQLNEMEELAKKMKLNNIYFEGFKDPRVYYERASIFAMTSSYEGFPMVLPEAMQYGVVPFAFKSFSSIVDIIDDKKDGILIEPFNIEQYATELSKLMSDNSTLKKMSINVVNKSKMFSIEEIGERWLSLFEDLR